MSELPRRLNSKRAWEIVGEEVKAAGGFTAAVHEGRFEKRCTGGPSGLALFFTRSQHNKLRRMLAQDRDHDIV